MSCVITASPLTYYIDLQAPHQQEQQPFCNPRTWARRWSWTTTAPEGFWFIQALGQQRNVEICVLSLAFFQNLRWSRAYFDLLFHIRWQYLALHFHVRLRFGHATASAFSNTLLSKAPVAFSLNSTAYWLAASTNHVGKAVQNLCLVYLLLVVS
jgi:hypothetical protein